MKLLLLSNQGCERPFEGLFDSIQFLHDGSDLLQIDEDSVVMFEGGTDISPKLYHQPRSRRCGAPDAARDTFEQQAFRRAMDVGASCIGICRGSQFLTAMSGGKIIQDIDGHGGDHYVETFEGKTFEVTSTHHQMMYPFDLDKDTDYVILAWATPFKSRRYINGFDKDIGQGQVPCEPDMVWYPQTRSLCIQSHPEYLNSIKGGMNSPFVQYCRKLTQDFILTPHKEQAQHAFELG